jgi:hypothetical protein
VRLRQGMPQDLAAASILTVLAADARSQAESDAALPYQRAPCSTCWSSACEIFARQLRSSNTLLCVSSAPKPRQAKDRRRRYRKPVRGRDRSARIEQRRFRPLLCCALLDLGPGNGVEINLGRP